MLHTFTSVWYLLVTLILNMGGWEWFCGWDFIAGLLSWILWVNPLLQINFTLNTGGIAHQTVCKGTIVIAATTHFSLLEISLNLKCVFGLIMYQMARQMLCFWPHIKNTNELLNLRALQFSPVNKIYIFQCMGQIFCVISMVPCEIPHKISCPCIAKMWFLYYLEFLRALR